VHPPSDFTQFPEYLLNARPRLGCAYLVRVRPGRVGVRARASGWKSEGRGRVSQYITTVNVHANVIVPDMLDFYPDARGLSNQ
jgi:hypothetical protein